MRPSAFGRKVTAYRAVARRYQHQPHRCGNPSCCLQQPSADIPVLIPDQAVVGDHVRVEVDLDLGVQGDDLQGGGQVFDEQFLGLVQVIHVGVAAVAVVGQRFHQRVIQVAYLTD